MLMDLFYSTLLPSIKRKRRVHFHAFMIDVHKRLHTAKIAMGFDGGDPIVPVARDLAEEAYVLCFDEFQVSIRHIKFVFSDCSLGHRYS
jgi:peroxisome-assembly ATPase